MRSGQSWAIAVALLATACTAGAMDESGQGFDWYAAVEATAHSNAPLQVVPQDDVYFVYYGGISYKTSASTRELETGVKGRFADYVEFSSFDNAELQMFVNFGVDTARGDFGGSAKFASLGEMEGQDLLILSRNRRNRAEFEADYKADFNRTSLAIGADVDYLNYTSVSLDNLDYLALGVNVQVGRSSGRMDAGFRYAHRENDYSDAGREDFSTDFFGVGLTYETGPHLAVGGHLGYSMADSATVEEGSLSGKVKATYATSEERTLVMLAYSQDFLPSSIGNFSDSMKIETSVRRMLNETFKVEVALTHEVSEYNSGETVDRTQIWGGASAELGRRSVAYLKVAWVMYGEQGGATIPGDYSVVTLGFKYGF